MDLAALVLPWLIDTFASWRMPLPDESAIGVNAGITPGKSGFSVFYSRGANQGNLGMLYSIGSVIAGHTDVHLSATYNRQITGWGLYAAAGLNLTYTVNANNSDDLLSVAPLDTLPAYGAAWNAHRFSLPELVFTLGESFWFGHRGRFGINADAGVALPLGHGARHTPYPVAGLGISWRFNFD